MDTSKGRRYVQGGINMASTWIYVMCIMLFGSYILQLVPLMFYLSVVLIVNCGVLAASYFLFRRDSLLNMRENMLFMLGLTVINILTDLGIMSYFMSWVAFGALLLWSLLGGGRGD